MKLKTFALALLAALGCTASAGAQTLPQFSDGNSEHWYYIKFSAGQAVPEDQGSRNTVRTKAVRTNRPAQLWKFTGTADDFTMQSKEGNYATCGDYLMTNSDASQAAHFKFVKCEVADYPDTWEIEWLGKSDEWNRWNQWGGSGLDKRIGFFTPGDGANSLTVIAEEDAHIAPVFEKINEFPTEAITGYTPDTRHTLWYTKPAGAYGVGDPWMEYGLPIGNGEFGAMTFGGIAQDRVQFNDKSLWTGTSTLRGCYQNFGDLYIEDISGTFGEGKPAKDYVRFLDMENAKSNAAYTSPDGKIKYTREYIASYPDKVVAVRLSASEAGKISVRLRLFNGVVKGWLAPEYKDGEISFQSRLDLVDFKAKVKAVATGGTVKSNTDNIEITGADEVLVILAGATNFDPHSPTYVSDATAMRDMVDRRVADAAAKGWQALLDDHTADFRTLSDRCNLTIGNAAHGLPIDEIVTNYNKRRPDRTDPVNIMLEELYWSMGRYLLISSSRGMDLPANLQGIWNHTDAPAWQCDIHSNINVQMNYWPAEVTNLSELHLPYLNYIKNMALDHPQWQEYARRSGQSKGWTCFTQNNIFGHSDYAENYVIANAWYATHLWQHYLYTLDRDFLKTQAFPVMKSCADFWMERLVKKDGKWLAPKEWSPEHGPAEEDGTAHAQQILYEFFREVSQALEILGDDAAADASFKTELAEKFRDLDPGLATETYTGKWGTTVNGVSEGATLLREWKYSTYDVGEDGHRHQSHLMAMYPFGQITPESEWFEPAVNSLALRGDLSTGWSLAWRIALWARALDAEHAHTIIVKALRHATSYGQSNGAGGIYYNLLDSHAPFQIDGNFGYTAGVAEMLMQSYGGTIRLLPAVPEEWKDGEIKGLKAEGNFEVSQTWKNRQLSTADISAVAGGTCRILYPGITSATLTDGNGNDVTCTKTGENLIEFTASKGMTYHLDMGNSGIESIGNDAKDSPVYNLQGIRVTRLIPGQVYIRNGRKFIAAASN